MKKELTILFITIGICSLILTSIQIWQWWYDTKNGNGTNGSIVQ